MASDRLAHGARVGTYTQSCGPDRRCGCHPGDLGGIDQLVSGAAGGTTGCSLANPAAQCPSSCLGQHFLLHKFGVNVAVDEFGTVEHLQVELNGGGNPRDGTFIQCPFHPGHGVLPVFAPNNHLPN